MITPTNAAGIRPGLFLPLPQNTTVLIRKELPITRQEGDVASVVFHVPELLCMDGRDARFGVFDRKTRTPIIEKTSEDTGEGEPSITISEQTITVPLLPDDTTGHAGDWVWELEVLNEDGPITIGRGPFRITNQFLL